MDTASERQRVTLDVLVTSAQKDALLSILRAMEIEVEALTDDQEDTALRLAMEEGRKSGIADDKAKKAFESWLFEQ